MHQSDAEGLAAEVQVGFGLGANLGQRQLRILRAIETLSHLVADLHVAPLYRTPAVSPTRQPDFLNTVVLGTTRVPAETLLAVAKRLEVWAGRELGPRLSARPLDVDLLFWGERIVDLPELCLPHPRMHERRFVLQPLADLDPGLPVGPDRRPAVDLATALSARQGVERVAWTSSVVTEGSMQFSGIAENEAVFDFEPRAG